MGHGGASRPGDRALSYGLASEFVGLQAPVLIGCLLALVAFLWACTRLARIEAALEAVVT